MSAVSTTTKVSMRKYLYRMIRWPLRAMLRRYHFRAMLQAALFFLNHTAFKLNSLWHVGYLRDNFCAFYVCSPLDFHSYSSARRPDFTKPPPLLGFVLSYFLVLVTPHRPLTLLRSSISLPPHPISDPVVRCPSSHPCSLPWSLACPLLSSR